MFLLNSKKFIPKNNFFKTLKLKFNELHEKIVYGYTPYQDTKLRFLLTIYFYGGVCGFLAGISNYIVGLDPINTYSVLIMSLAFFVLHRSLFQKWIGFLAGLRLFYGFSALCFNTLWFFNAGVDGGIVIFFFLLVIVIMVYSEGWERIVHLSAVVLNITILMYINYYYNDWIIPYPGKLERYIDLFVCIVICLVVSYIAISVVLNALKRTNLELEDKYRIIQKDLDLAWKIQNAVMKPSIMEARFEVGFLNIPASGVGGDAFTIQSLDSGYYRFFLADATGHGVQAGLVTMLILSEFFSIMNEKLNPGEILTLLNQAFMKKYFDIRVIFPCIVLDIDLNKKEFYFASAGHIPQIFIQEDVINFLEKTGPIIGLKPNNHYFHRSIHFNSNDIVFLFSDGLTEVFSKDKIMYGEEQMETFLKNNSTYNSSVQNYLNLWLEDVYSFNKNKILEDDFTLIGIRMNE